MILQNQNISLKNIAKEDTSQQILNLLSNSNENIELSDISSKLDDLLLASMAALQLCGIEGEIFTLTNNNTGQVKTITIDNTMAIGNSGIREKRVYVTPGTWNIHANIPNVGEASGVIDATTISYVYHFSYEIYGSTKIAEFDVSGSYSMPENCLMLVGYAAGAGGAGGNGCNFGMLQVVEVELVQNLF